jgi:plasmid stabilization system protein ParE
MDFQVIWSDAASKDLHDVCSYIARDNPEAALGMGDGILDHVAILSMFPFIGPAYPRGEQGPYGKLSFAPLALSMMYPKNRAEWKS